MPRARPVHNLSPRESALVHAIAAERADEGERARALRLKETIETYWRERGFAVEVRLVEAGFHPAVREARIELQSGMVNGMPKTEGE